MSMNFWIIIFFKLLFWDGSSQILSADTARSQRCTDPASLSAAHFHTALFAPSSQSLHYNNALRNKVSHCCFLSLQKSSQSTQVVSMSLLCSRGPPSSPLRIYTLTPSPSQSATISAVSRLSQFRLPFVRSLDLHSNGSVRSSHRLCRTQELVLWSPEFRSNFSSMYLYLRKSSQMGCWECGLIGVALNKLGSVSLGRSKQFLESNSDSWIDQAYRLGLHSSVSQSACCFAHISFPAAETSYHPILPCVSADF